MVRDAMGSGLASPAAERCCKRQTRRKRRGSRQCTASGRQTAHAGEARLFDSLSLARDCWRNQKQKQSRWKQREIATRIYRTSAAVGWNTGASGRSSASSMRWISLLLRSALRSSLSSVSANRLAGSSRKGGGRGLRLRAERTDDSSVDPLSISVSSVIDAREDVAPERVSGPCLQSRRPIHNQCMRAPVLRFPPAHPLSRGGGCCTGRNHPS